MPPNSPHPLTFGAALCNPALARHTPAVAALLRHPRVLGIALECAVGPTSATWKQGASLCLLPESDTLEHPSAATPTQPYWARPLNDLQRANIPDIAWALAGLFQEPYSDRLLMRQWHSLPFPKQEHENVCMTLTRWGNWLGISNLEEANSQTNEAWEALEQTLPAGTDPVPAANIVPADIDPRINGAFIGTLLVPSNLSETSAHQQAAYAATLRPAAHHMARILGADGDDHSWLGRLPWTHPALPSLTPSA